MANKEQEVGGKIPKTKLSATANPSVFLDKQTGECYYLYISPTDLSQEPRLIKLNEGA